MEYTLVITIAIKFHILAIVKINNYMNFTQKVLLILCNNNYIILNCIFEQNPLQG